LNTTDYREQRLYHDSVKLNSLFWDEASKWEHLSYLEHWSNIEPTMIQVEVGLEKLSIGSKEAAQ
jgi:hypothetical protein